MPLHSKVWAGKGYGGYFTEVAARKLPLPQVTMMLGDNDTYIIERADVWAKPASLAKKAGELARLKDLVQMQANRAFPEFDVRVRLWSEYYEPKQADNELRRSQDTALWNDWGRLFAQSRMIYLEQWKYRELGRQKGISDEDMLNFIRGDVIRTAAQYAVERDIVRGLGAIQAWAEAVPCWDWPLWISHYANSTEPDELTPSLFLTR